ncbi:MAG: hypothetical protein U1D70_06770 [Methylobacter sp.]|nr:hypothetical protein [Methylobacter sp.]MDP2427083.1 hypothetical protein [Methylobacter sp.]MDP3053061.1 hypothetical protein [Methylobacter sp.]MDP3363244.1 hypothetical protein [Methylobacter sp.]MDZ4218711.1 hypothetical protein [Methylobacter sp.]
MSRIVWLFLSAVLFISSTQAKPLTPEQVPEPLKPWIAWALQDSPESVSCPFIYNSYEQKRCSWPTQTQLDLTGAKGLFSMNWTVYQDNWISLPGDKTHWPLNVTVNDKAALVMDKNGIPSIKLAAGAQYRIKGEFLWDAVPDNLKIPADTGLVELRINGAAIPTPTLKNGQLWLKASEIGAKKPENRQNSLDIQVFRHITDDVPAQVLTRLVLEVSGEQREVKLPRPLLDGFISLSLHSPLPARLEPDGRLLIQLRPGHWQLDITARNTQALNSLPLPGGQDAPWPDSELWVFDARPQLRVVEIEHLSAIDASLTNLPDEWKQLPAYKIGQGQAMGFKTIRRGDPEPEPNQLNLSRKLWLDFDGEGYTVNDTITGTMTRDWRLNTLPSTQLGKASLNGSNQFITQDKSGKQGVEVRTGTITLDADSRIVGAVNSTSAVGWEQDFHSVRAELNLPPGWRLLAAGGVDNVPDSWISRWTLLDLFVVLIAALATGRLWNPYWGGLALLTLVLIWHEPGAPQFVWLNILAATALIKVLPTGRLLRFVSVYRTFFWLVLIMTALPFMVAQVRTGLYPQLEKPWQGAIMPASPQYAEMAGDMAEITAPATETMVGMKKQTLRRVMPSEYLAESYNKKDSAVDFERVDPKAKVQTGPGLPQWQWHTVQLSWNGAVDAGQQLQLWYLTPTLTLVLNFVRVLLIAVLAALMFGAFAKVKFKDFRTAAPLLLWCVLLPLLSLPSADVYAELPDKALLDELRARLLEKPLPPDCVPNCAQIQTMKLAISDKELSIALQIHAHQAVAVPLPADYEQWFPSQIRVDGNTATGLYRDNSGLWINLDAGEHQVVLNGAAPLLSKFTLPLPLQPNWAGVQTNGWQVIGLQEHGQVDQQLQFSRTNQTAQQQSQAALEPAALPPFVRVERTLQLGLDWRVITRIIRVSPADSAVILAVPLLPGESVISAGIRVKDGKVEVNIPAQQSVLQWESTLAKSEQIDVVATQTEQWVEVLKADISPIWHLETAGIAMIHLNNSGQWLPEWRPWPGEKITLHITRPAAAEGQTLTIDNSRLTIKPGQRSREALLNLSLRSSQGSQHTLTLPEQAVLQSVAINGQTQPLRQEGRKLTLPINPGQQNIAISWREATGISTMMSTPPVDLGSASVNANLTIGLGQDRWVLFALGPKMGPAILFWGVLLVIFIVSLGLGKVPLTPLKNRHWFLLLIGLSQIPLLSAVMVVAWLMLLGWRKTQAVADLRYFNTLQVMLGGLTLVALSLLFYAVEQGLLGSPDMQIIGNQSSAFNLNWYQDRSAALLPTATLISVPLMAYRVLMLAWSLWLAVALLNWLKWGWACFSTNGIWHKPLKTDKTLAVEPEEK